MPLGTFWICEKVNCELLRAMKMLSMASDATCRAIMSCCEEAFAEIATPNTLSTASSPVVKINIEIMTSRSEKPDFEDFGEREESLIFMIDSRSIRPRLG